MLGSETHTPKNLVIDVGMNNIHEAGYNDEKEYEEDQFDQAI